MIRLIALKAHDYGGRAIRIGQEYEAADPYADALVRARVSRLAGAEMQTRPMKYQTKEQEPEPIADEKPIRKKRQYKRKEMTPEE